MSRVKCSICAHPESLAISSALEAGVKQLDIASQFGVSKFSVSRHRNHCLGPPPAEELSNSAEALVKWMQRCEDTYLAASANSDVRSAVAALSAAFRGIQAAEKQREKDRQEQGENSGQLPNGETPMTVEAMDTMVKTFIHSRSPNPCPYCGGRTNQGRAVEPATPDQTAKENLQ